MGDISKNFSRHEFSCKGKNCCGGAAPVTTELITALQQLRDLSGEPLIVTSGFRCMTHNAMINGAPLSYHTKGMAADIKSPHLTPAQLARFAEQVPAFRAGGIAVYDGFVHVDVRTSGPWRG